MTRDWYLRLPQYVPSAAGDGQLTRFRRAGLHRYVTSLVLLPPPRRPHSRLRRLPAVWQQVSRIVTWPTFDSGKVRGASNIAGLSDTE